MNNVFKNFAIAFLLFTGIMVTPAARTSAQVFTGGEIAVNFMGNITADIAPMVGYKIQNFRVGVSPVVMYTATGNTTGDLSYGGRVFAEYLIYQGFFGHAECEALNTGHYNWSTLSTEHAWTIGAPIGVGYEKEITKGVWFKSMVLYDPLLDLNLDQSSAKANPSVRGGIVYQF